MALSRLPAAAMQQTMRLLGTGSAAEMAIRQAAWVARCVGRGEAAPLRPEDVTALAATLHTRAVERGAVLFHSGTPTEAVWIVQRGRVELSVGSGRRRSVVHVLQPGDVDGDIQHLLDMPLPYTGAGARRLHCPVVDARPISSGCWPRASTSRAGGCPAWRSGSRSARHASSGCSAGR